MSTTTTTIANLLAPGTKTRVIGHLEIWFIKGKHPVDPTRAPGYDQSNPADVKKHVAQLKATGYDVIMMNTYGQNSAENVAMLLYIAECEAQGLNFMINIDKGVYASLPLAQQQAAIESYLTYLQTHAFGSPAYEKYQGKLIVTYFVQPGDARSMFAAIEKNHQSTILFVYNDASKADPNGSLMAWVQSDLVGNATWWAKTYGAAPAGQLRIPCIACGFNDTVTKTVGGKQLACTVWGTTAARVWGPPSQAVLEAFADAFNAANTGGTRFPYVQFVTINDWDEGTALEAKFDGTGGYIVPPPPTIVSGIILIDGAPVDTVQPGPHTATVVQVFSDGSRVSTVTEFTV